MFKTFMYKNDVLISSHEFNYQYKYFLTKCGSSIFLRRIDEPFFLTKNQENDIKNLKLIQSFSSNKLSCDEKLLYEYGRRLTNFSKKFSLINKNRTFIINLNKIRGLNENNPEINKDILKNFELKKFIPKKIIINKDLILKDENLIDPVIFSNDKILKKYKKSIIENLLTEHYLTEKDTTELNIFTNKIMKKYSIEKLYIRNFVPKYLTEEKILLNKIIQTFKYFENEEFGTGIQTNSLLNKYEPKKIDNKNHFIGLAKTNNEFFYKKYYFFLSKVLSKHLCDIEHRKFMKKIVCKKVDNYENKINLTSLPLNIKYHFNNYNLSKGIKPEDFINEKIIQLEKFSKNEDLINNRICYLEKEANAEDKISNKTILIDKLNPKTIKKQNYYKFIFKYRNKLIRYDFTRLLRQEIEGKIYKEQKNYFIIKKEKDNSLLFTNKLLADLKLKSVFLSFEKSKVLEVFKKSIDSFIVKQYSLEKFNINYLEKFADNHIKIFDEIFKQEILKKINKKYVINNKNYIDYKDVETKIVKSGLGNNLFINRPKYSLIKKEKNIFIMDIIKKYLNNSYSLITKKSEIFLKFANLTDIIKENKEKILKRVYNTPISLSKHWFNLDIKGQNIDKPELDFMLEKIFYNSPIEKSKYEDNNTLLSVIKMEFPIDKNNYKTFLLKEIAKTFKLNKNNKNKRLELKKRWWFLRPTKHKVKIEIPSIDYDYNDYHLLGEEEDPFKNFTNKGKENIEISIEIYIDLLNIILMWWCQSGEMLQISTGEEALKGLYNVLNNWMTLDSSLKQVREAGSEEEYQRCFRIIAWHMEAEFYNSKVDKGLYQKGINNKLYNGNYYMSHLVDDLLIYVEEHFYDVVPLFKGNKARMSEARSSVTNHDYNDDIINEKNIKFDKVDKSSNYKKKIIEI